MRLALAAVLPVILACDPVYSVRGSLVDASGTPLAGATVTMTCPSGRIHTVTSTAAGEFDFGGVSGASEAQVCTLRIEKPGFVTQTVPTTSVCLRGTATHNAAEPCRPGEGKVTLAAAAAAAPAPPSAPSSAVATGKACSSNADCPGGSCRYASPGCPGAGKCGDPVATCVASRPYCACDGRTFFSCPDPGRPWSSATPCADAAPR